MPLPDYEFYTASYLGEKIPQESFARFITRAARQLERYKSMFDVRPRAGLQEPEACALCAMADAMYAFAEEDKRCRVVSASVGSVSETYAAPPELCAKTIQSREGYLRALAQDYLVFGRYASGLAELIAVVLLLTPRTITLGAALSVGVITGAIGAHLTKLGIVVQNDGGLLFALALVVLFGSLGILAIRRRQIPVVGKLLPF